MKPSEKFMSNWNCVACGGVGYTYPGEMPCVACINAGKEYRRLRQLEQEEELPPVLAIPGAIVPNGRRVILYEGSCADLPEFTTGCSDCDRMPVGQLCDRCDYDMTVEASSYRCQ